MIGVAMRVIVTAVLGVAIGFFVAVSGFADGSARERVLTVGLIAVAYGFVGLALGYRASLWYGLGLAAPGLVVLLLYTTGERGWWFLAYAALIVAVATLGAYGGVRLGQRRG